MGYIHIDNLYKNPDILLFKECYALEKIDGTSAHIRIEDYKLSFYSGGANYEDFIDLFDQEYLLQKLKGNCITIFGEAYGGKVQGMSHTYGDALKFIVFDIRIGEKWLSVLDAEKMALSLDLDFVSYKKICTDVVTLDRERSLPSVQAKRNNMGDNIQKEGLILRPIIEVRKNNGARIIAKYKNENWRETRSKRKIIDPEKLKTLENAKEIADEWVTLERLKHVLDKTQVNDMKQAKTLIFSMIDDIKREATSEIKWSKAVEKQIGKTTIKLFKEKLKKEFNIL